MIIKHKRIHGAPRDTKRFRPFDLDDYIEPISTEVYGKVRRVSVKAQSNQLEKFVKALNSKGTTNSVLCIAGKYSDMRAMQVAAHIAPTSAKWHRVISGFHDDLLVKKPNVPVLVLSNIVEQSTPHKLEKVRDLLDTYDTIPRIVCIGGIDPLKFFGERINYKLTCSLYLSTVK